MLLLAGAMAAMTLAITMWFPAGPDPRIWLAALPVPAAAMWAFSPIASCFSALFPVATDLDVVGSRGGNAHTVSNIVAMLAFPASFAAILLPAILVWRWSGSAYAAAAVTFGMSGVAGVVALPLQRVAAKVLASRRDNLLLVAAGR